MKKINLPLQILIALALAVVFGSFFPQLVKYTNWMGDIFLKLLKMIVIPLILTSIISGVSNLGEAKNIGRLGLKTMGYYVLTSTLAIVTGLLAVNIIKPGKITDVSIVETKEKLVEVKGSIGDTLMNIVPENIFDALTNNNGVLSIIFIAIVFGYFINKLDADKRATLNSIVNSSFELIMKVTLFIIKFTPLGVFGIVAKVMAENDILVLCTTMGWYMLTVILALAVHAFFSLPMILVFLAKVFPFKFFSKMSSPLLTAFSTSSSNATLPLTMETIEKKVGVSNKVTSFTLPLGATVNMDGTALYECVATIFIAQCYNIDLSLSTQIVIVIIALLTSIGAAGIPMAGMFMITVILQAVGLPLEGVGIILAVDRILDMFRTATNVWSDSCGAILIANSEGEKVLKYK